MSFFSSAARRLVPFCSAFIQIVQVFLRISAVFLPSNCNFPMQSVFAKSCIFRRTQCKSPHFLHVQKMLPARIVYLHSCPPDGCDLFHEICIFSGRWGNAIIHPSTTGKSLSNQCCVYSPCSPHGFLFFSFLKWKHMAGAVQSCGLDVVCFSFVLRYFLQILAFLLVILFTSSFYRWHSLIGLLQ